MIVSIHQPQYMPWLPYYSKIARSDIFVFLDNVQYQKNGLQNRNELKNSNGRFWLTVPVSVHLGDRLNEVKIVKNGWSKKHVKSISLNYAKSSNYKYFTDYIQPIIEREFESLVDLNIKIIETVCNNYFKIDTKIVRQTDLGASGKGSKLILDICKNLGIKKYLSGPGAKNYIDENEFEENGIEIDYMDNETPAEYPQLYKKQGFINDLSALDFNLNVGPDWRRYYVL
jgi:hypothetical protein